jgi:HK97 gp10 family phage protein
MADAVTMRLEIKGLPELLRKLQRLGGDVENAVAASLMASALTVAGDAKRRAPVKTGNLSRSITATGAQDGAITDTAGGPLPPQSVEGLAQQLRNGGQAEAYVATNVVYAATQEFMPYEHAHGESPYLRPALDENRDEVERIFRNGLQQVIRKAGG